MSAPKVTKFAKENVRAFVLVCAKSPEERIVSAKRQLAQWLPHIQNEFVMGYVGTDTIIDEIYDVGLNSKWLKRPLVDVEIAIYAGHRKVWQSFLESHAEIALVLEDDFKFADPQIVTKAVGSADVLLASGRNFIKLFDFDQDKSRRIHSRLMIDGNDLIQWHSPRAGAVAYLISREGARRFLKRPLIYRQVDEDIKYYWELGLDPWSIAGNPVTENSLTLGGSLAENDRSNRVPTSIVKKIHGNLLTLHRKIMNRIQIMKRKLQSLSKSRAKPG